MPRRRPTLPIFAVWLGAGAVLAMAVVLVLDLNGATQQSERALVSARVSEAYRQAHDAQSRQEIALNWGSTLSHVVAADNLRRSLRRAYDLDPGEAPRVTALLREHNTYLDAAATNESLTASSTAESLEEGIGRESDRAAREALALDTAAYAAERRVVRGGRVEIAIATIIFAALWLMFRHNRRRLDDARTQEIERLAEMASTDPLTGLRNHRIFHEDLARELQRTARTGVPLALVLLDLDDLKTLNDNHGHQAGDERIRALADGIRATQRAADISYRIGGDEFAVILPDARAWGALEFTQRLRTALPGFTATAGIADADTLRPRDALIHDADMALLTAKRLNQDAAIYTPELDPATEQGTVDEHDLASALARAVDAKDAYTRSHCQTVSQLTALIGAELGFTGDRLANLRLAGLLHDVGKIGVPDAILNKPAALTDEEYEVMQAHSVLGYEIVEAAGLPEHARWVRHHHERVDGRGYPDQLAQDEIPLQSRIILVADAFEAMTSDRPYRKAPGREFAIAELRRGAGSQFDETVVDALCRILERTGEPSLIQN